MKNAIKITLLILSVILISLVSVSCENASKSENAIIGKWSYVSHGNTNTIEFLDNGKFYATTYQPVFSDDINSSYNIDNPFPVPSSYTADNITGNYVINGNKITITNTDSGIMQISTFAVSSTTLTLTTGGTESSGMKTSQETIMYKRAK